MKNIGMIFVWLLVAVLVVVVGVQAVQFAGVESVMKQNSGARAQIQQMQAPPVVVPQGAPVGGCGV